MSSTNGTDPAAGLPYPVLTPTPNRERFRLRVEVFLPQDAHSYNAKPYHSFIIAKGRSLDLPELSLRELRDVVVYRYKTIYPNETLFQISKTTNSHGDDLFLDDLVGDIFADNEVFRVIKGASIRESLPRNYRESREASLQPSYQPSHNANRKRSPNTSNMGDLSRAGKRQRLHESERPIPSIERFAVIDEEDEGLLSGGGGTGAGQEDAEIPDAEVSQLSVEAPQHPVANGVKTSTIVAAPVTSQTPIVSRKRGRPRKSLAASPALLPVENRPPLMSTSPILPPTIPGARKVIGTPATPTGAVQTLDTLGTVKISQMLPPPTIPQRISQSLPSPSELPHSSALGSSPATGALQAGPNTAKKGRRVSFVEPSPQAANPINGGAQYSDFINGSSSHSQNGPSAETAIEEDDAHSQLGADEQASSSQHKDSATLNDKLGKRKAATISVYKKEELAKEKIAAAEKFEKEAAKETEKKLAAEKKAEKDAVKLAEKKLAAEKKAEAKAAKEAKTIAKAKAKEAKQKAKDELKRASSAQKDAKSAASTPKAAALTKASVPITYDGADTLMSGVADNETAMPPTSPTGPPPQSLLAPPSSPTMPEETPRRATPEPQPDRSPFEASSPDSVSTSRSQRDSRSPVHFVTAASKASKASFPGSGQKQSNDEGSDSEESESSDDEDDDLNAASTVKPKTPAQATTAKSDAASTQSMRSTSYIPPPSQPRFSEIRDAYKQKLQVSRGSPSLSQRPAAMAHLPSLKNQTAQAVATRHAEMERIRLEGQAKAKAIHDEKIAKRQEDKVEESEADTDSSSDDSDSDSDGSSSDSDAKKTTPKNKRLMGLNGGPAPASASKAEGKKKKTMSFGAIKKRHSMGGSLR